MIHKRSTALERSVKLFLLEGLNQFNGAAISTLVQMWIKTHRCFVHMRKLRCRFSFHFFFAKKPSISIWYSPNNFHEKISTNGTTIGEKADVNDKVKAIFIIVFICKFGLNSSISLEIGW